MSLFPCSSNGWRRCLVVGAGALPSKIESLLATELRCVLSRRRPHRKCVNGRAGRIEWEAREYGVATCSAFFSGDRSTGSPRA